MPLLSPIRPWRAMLSLLLLVAPTAAAAQDTLPSPRSLIDRHLTAVGGRDAIVAKPYTTTKSTMEMAAMGVRLEVTTVHGPSQMVVTSTMAGLGEMNTGFNGEVGWSVNPMQGARLLQGSELDQLREETGVAATLRDPKLFKVMETVGRTEEYGIPCYKVRLVWQSGRESADCYEVRTGLMVATESTQDSPMGTLKIVSRMTDYQEFDGVRVPTRLMQEMMGQQQITTVHSVERSTTPPVSFDPPPQIQTLLRQQK